MIEAVSMKLPAIRKFEWHGQHAAHLKAEKSSSVCSSSCKSAVRPTRPVIAISANPMTRNYCLVAAKGPFQRPLHTDSSKESRDLSMSAFPPSSADSHIPTARDWEELRSTVTRALLPMVAILTLILVFREWLLSTITSSVVLVLNLMVGSISAVVLASVCAVQCLVLLLPSPLERLISSLASSLSSASSFALSLSLALLDTTPAIPVLRSLSLATATLAVATSFDHRPHLLRANISLSLLSSLSLAFGFLPPHIFLALLAVTIVVSAVRSRGEGWFALIGPPVAAIAAVAESPWLQVFIVAAYVAAAVAVDGSGMGRYKGIGGMNDRGSVGEEDDVKSVPGWVETFMKGIALFAMVVGARNAANALYLRWMMVM